ncbi:MULTISPECIES: TIGR04086 family membrane protein [Bacillaceae]|uniref:TIGR04086 family membrane protein n=1 Tax=Bacillaceae TaxID=186817 RepID=UPI001BDE48EC|nr:MULTISPECIES: TIGR04086 family membrane protein [Bacillaceae]MDX8359445.1 TIGR04086 family membrane protein [Cytobacillus sp. IB215316]
METKKMSGAVLYGVLTILIIVLGMSMLFSLLLRFTNLNELSLSWVITIVGFIAVFIGGFVSGGKGKEKGWLVGAMTSIVYTFIVFLVQYLGYDSPFTLQQLLFHTGFLVTSIFGGIIGVNISSSPTRET